MNDAIGTHIGLTVSDLRRSIDFYVGCLGFKIAEPGRVVCGADIDRVQGLQDVRIELAFLHNGALALELMHYLHPRGKPEHPALCDPGCHHLSFAVADVVAMYQDLRAKGVLFLGPPSPSPRSGRFTVLLRDPDGSIVELIQGGGFRVPGASPGSEAPGSGTAARSA